MDAIYHLAAALTAEHKARTCHDASDLRDDFDARIRIVGCDVCLHLDKLWRHLQDEDARARAEHLADAAPAAHGEGA